MRLYRPRLPAARRAQNTRITGVKSLAPELHPGGFKLNTPTTQQQRKWQSEYASAYYHANRERLLEQKRQARRNNPEKDREYDRQRRGTEIRKQMLKAADERLMEKMPWRRLLREIKKRAKKKGLDFDLTDQWGAERWTGRCEVTGLEFQRTSSKSCFLASVDRIDSALGYTKGNCRFVLMAVNMLKFVGTDEDMFRVASAIVNNRR